MYPVLIKLGPLAVRTYGFLLVLAFVMGIWFSARRAKKQGSGIEWLPDLSLIVLISAIVGSRFFYVIYHLKEFEGRILDMINPIQSTGEIGIGGLSMFGGLVLAIVCGIVYVHIKKLGVWKIADIVAPSIMLGLSIARIGCFLNGCCFGNPSESSLSVIFPYNSPGGYMFPDTPIFPIQLVASFLGFFIFGMLLLLERFKRFDGFTFWLMLIFYSAARFTIDFFRYYEESMIFLRMGGASFTVNQALIVLIFIVSVFMWIYLRRKSKVETSFGYTLTTKHEPEG
ncbi:MAG: prolipoprotein diacylglyceryl transferase [candidate division Zixibacteria bacterium]|nr:prolipoprotein diacylglyceryl transferase [candidate division Zixibacteria bacterium]